MEMFKDPLLIPEEDPHLKKKKRGVPFYKTAKDGIMKDGSGRKKRNAVYRSVFRKTKSQRLVAREKETQHSFLYNMLNPRSRHLPAVIFKGFIATVIMVDLFFFVMSTEPRYKNHPIFAYAEGISSTIFLLEYLCRLIIVVESKRYSNKGAFRARIQYIFSYGALVDALATFPFFVELLSGFQLPTLTYLRVFRLLRILKTEAYADAMNSVVRVIYFNREILYVAMCMCAFMVLITAFLMYYLRPSKDNDGNDDANDDFRSIPTTMYLATLMLTGQGGPDNDTDLPWYTKIVVLITSAFSLAMFAIPASMLTWGFEAEAERKAAASRKRRKRQLERRRRRQEAQRLGTSAVPLDGSSSSSSSEDDWYGSGDDSSDEEYQKIISGEGADEDNNAEAARKEKLKSDMMKLFEQASVSKSGSMDLDEFVSYVAKQRPVVEAMSAAPQPTTDVMSRIQELEKTIKSMDEKLDNLIKTVGKRR